MYENRFSFVFGVYLVIIFGIIVFLEVGFYGFFHMEVRVLYVYRVFI